MDFCAYQSGEVRTLLENLSGSFGQYILISTADVYARDDRSPKDEQAPLLTGRLSCPSGDYTFQKLLLEKEAAAVCAQKGIALTILRPAFLYGPYNYAPREPYYIEKIVKQEPIPVPADSDSRFQFVYVKDAAEAIVRCVGNARACGQKYNLAAPEEVTYARYMEALSETSDIPFETVPVTVEDVLRDGIPLPFPLTADENELFLCGKAARELGLCYTPLEEGMRKSYSAFKPVFDR